LPFVSTLWRPFCGCNFKIGCGQPKFPQKRCCCKHFQTPVKLLGEGPPVQSRVPYLCLFSDSQSPWLFSPTQANAILRNCQLYLSRHAILSLSGARVLRTLGWEERTTLQIGEVASEERC
jgi:hypothetical protein